MSRALRSARLTTPLIAASLLAGGLTIWSLGLDQARAATPAADKGSAAAAAKASDDFNGDGYADLVVGAPGGTISGQKKAGYVAVTYGSKEGLKPASKQLISRSTAGVPGAAAAKQEFGKSVTKGDLDGDGFTDLVIGADGDGYDGNGADAGAVILWGSATGLTGGTKIATFGYAPQAGDFDGDGKTDLALFAKQGSHGDDPVGQNARLWKGPIARTGTPAGTGDFMDKSQWWSYETDERPDLGCADRPQTCVDGPQSVMGPVVPQAVGDFNGDGRSDIALNQHNGDGQYQNRVLYGSPTGFTTEWAPGYEGALAVGDINGDHYDDLVAGTSNDDAKVKVAYGSKDGLKTDTQSFDQDLPGVPGAEEEGDEFGASVAVSDVDGDGFADIALGTPGEDVRDLADAGSVVLVRGSASGVTGTGAQAFHQDTAGVPGAAEGGDRFGEATALLDVNGDGHRDLAAAAIHENADTGAVWSLPGTTTGLTATNSVAMAPKDLGAPDAAALFGSALR
ncbi:FG-GAP and VCBS repeat-containing protein [Streptomyces kanamyceticus]|uniref:VCBS repeat-containing protein n=1 Tax=Streptomyces kanamyceticus TaxID=1967 RepID=A0A5J6GR19_STRKN|nr:FG-GAP and VCBS repeat-containing protein [Streptomyces kanamyceticus]QEU96611.1 hypothetical protein CP970_41770 [Streptomyces kanamyceticus]